jgi:DNA-directed RNA polymerase subunit RPC12/RpoP
MMIPTRSFRQETYRCSQCERELAGDDIEHDWKCPTCQVPVHIYAQEETGSRAILVRIKASELSEGRPVVLWDLTNTCRTLEVSRVQGNVRIVLKGHNPAIEHPDKFITCRVGGW